MDGMRGGSVVRKEVGAEGGTRNLTYTKPGDESCLLWITSYESLYQMPFLPFVQYLVKFWFVTFDELMVTDLYVGVNV